MRAEAAQVLAPQFNDMLSLCAQPFLQPIYDLEVPHMAFGRVAVLGDAAFVARPHVGAGVAKAAEDALALADALDAGDIESGLKQFEAARLPVGEKIIERARRLGAYVQADLKTQAERVYAALHRKPEAVLSRNRDDEFLSACAMTFAFNDATRRLIAEPLRGVHAPAGRHAARAQACRRRDHAGRGR